MLNLNTGILAALPVSAPPLNEQRRIAGVLGALDNLIETDRQQASTVDELWHAVVEDSVVKGEAVRLSSLASFVNGKNFTGRATGSGMPVIRTPEVRNGPDTSTARSAVAVEDENVVRAGDVLFVWSGSLLVGRWYWEPGLINQHIFKVVPSQGVPIWLAYWAVERLMTEFLGVAADKATTMGHIKRADLDRQVTVPPKTDWAALDRIIHPLWDEVIQARTEANDLAKTRDELLPLLMSGRVRVRPKAVSDARQTGSIADHEEEP
jgi:type I restriction enzyme S subunit